MHLLWEWALRAIGIVLHAKIFIDLEQPLLVCDGFQKISSARVVAKKTCGGRFQSSIRQLGRQRCVFCPEPCARPNRSLWIVGQPKWKEHIREQIGDPRFADQRHFLGRCSGCECVMKIPKRVLERFKKIVRCSDAALAGSALKPGPIARQGCQRG